jgi:hypothetical protein
MTEPPPRQRFQFHLSTAIVLMFVAGAVMWANIRGTDHDYGELGLITIMNVQHLVVAILILSAVWFLCEWLIRHRTVRMET